MTVHDLRVALVVDNLSTGGAERVVERLAYQLRGRNVDVHVVEVDARLGRGIAERLRSDGFPIIDLGMKSLFDPRPALRLAHYVRRNSIDLLHSHLDYADLVARIAGKLTGRPVISTIHRVQETDSGRLAAIRHRLDYWSARVAGDFSICVSDAARDFIVERTGVEAAKTKTVFNGVDSERFKPDQEARRRLRGELGISPTALVFANVSVLRPEKGLQHLIAAGARVVETAPESELLLVGQGPEEGFLRAEAARQGFSDHVHFLGFRSDIEDLLNTADVYVQPSLFDALPTSILEAMATALPVVASRVGGIPEIVQDRLTGLLTPPADPEALAAALLTLAHTELRTSFGEAGRRWVEKYASMNVWTQTNIDIYQQVVRRRIDFEAAASANEAHPAASQQRNLNLFPKTKASAQRD